MTRIIQGLNTSEAVSIYLKRGDEIFDVPFWEKIKRAGGLNDEKYPPKALEDALHDFFGDTELKELIKPCLMYVSGGKPLAFKARVV